MVGARNTGTCEGGTVVKVRLEGQIKSLIGTPQLHSQNNQKPSAEELKQRWRQEGVLLVLQIRKITACQVEWTGEGKYRDSRIISELTKSSE